MVEEYTLSVDCPLGTIVGPGRYGMYWVARDHVRMDGLVWGTTFRSAMPTDLEAVLSKSEPGSLVELRLRQRRHLNSDESRAAYAEGQNLRKLITPKSGRVTNRTSKGKPH
jgi:hypothetical protein